MHEERKHIPAEIFGFPPKNQSDEAEKARSEYLCPFIRKKCTKQTRLLSYPLGICSVWHAGAPRIICPQRFYFEELKLLKTIARNFLRGEFNLVSEVELEGYGKVDWVGFTITDVEEVKEFIGIEIMADSTTQTGQLVDALKDFMERKTLKERYNYGMNTYNTIKLSFTQMLNKGQVFEKWEKYYIWVLQDVLLQDLVNRFKLEMHPEISEDNKIVFASLHMEFDEQKNIFILKLEKYYSTSVEEMLHAYRRADIPNIKEFTRAILRKFRKDSSIDIKTKKLTDFFNI